MTNSFQNLSDQSSLNGEEDVIHAAAVYLKIEEEEAIDSRDSRGKHRGLLSLARCCLSNCHIKADKVGRQSTDNVDKSVAQICFGMFSVSKPVSHSRPYIFFWQPATRMQRLQGVPKTLFFAIHAVLSVIPTNNHYIASGVFVPSRTFI